MSKTQETRIQCCKYGNEKKLINAFSIFGWNYSSKQLLNRFGNPLPYDTKLDESELREKCSYNVSFTREIEQERARKLDKLQSEYFELKEYQRCFSGKRVTGCVFLTVAIILFIILTFSFYGANPNNSNWVFALVALLIALLGLIAVIITGVFGVINNCKKSDEVKKRKEQIIKEAKEILKTEIE